ncbi:hypothetical protein SAMN05421636_11234 [Pricia antarctica]|uniref:Uncharacterized protein n=1 Tax=Pricia antarctica TaxID=641691 RepID=A0A1G7IHV0_9FLAO|nr:hypothetical protein SAMN05421636_11234 [Pricia antarctica]
MPELNLGWEAQIYIFVVPGVFGPAHKNLNFIFDWPVPNETVSLLFIATICFILVKW